MREIKRISCETAQVICSEMHSKTNIMKHGNPLLYKDCFFNVDLFIYVTGHLSTSNKKIQVFLYDMSPNHKI